MDEPSSAGVAPLEPVHIDDLGQRQTTNGKVSIEAKRCVLGGEADDLFMMPAIKISQQQEGAVINPVESGFLSPCIGHLPEAPPEVRVEGGQAPPDAEHHLTHEGHVAVSAMVEK